MHDRLEKFEARLAELERALVEARAREEGVLSALSLTLAALFIKAGMTDAEARMLRKQLDAQAAFAPDMLSDDMMELQRQAADDLVGRLERILASHQRAIRDGAE